MFFFNSNTVININWGGFLCKATLQVTWLAHVVITNLRDRDLALSSNCTDQVVNGLIANYQVSSNITLKYILGFQYIWVSLLSLTLNRIILVLLNTEWDGENDHWLSKCMLFSPSSEHSIVGVKLFKPFQSHVNYPKYVKRRWRGCNSLFFSNELTIKGTF